MKKDVSNPGLPGRRSSDNVNMLKKKKIRHINLPHYCYSIVTNTKNRISWFSNPDFANEVIDAIYFYRERYCFKLLTFVVMPDHLHLLIIPSDEKSVSEIMKEIKRTSSIMINKRLKRKGPFWQEGYFEDILEGSKMVTSKLDYIHRNPVKAGLCEIPEEFEFSSANEKWEKDWDML